MTGIRYHALAATTSLVTLAAGVVLGVGPITDHQDAARDQRVGGLQQKLADRNATAENATRQAAQDQALATSLAAPLLRNQLAGHTVVLVAAPGADRTVLRRTSTAVRTAGATVTGTLRLHADYVDPTKAASPLEDLALRLVPPGVTFPDGADPIARVGTVLARSTATKDASASGAIDQKAAELVAGLEELTAISFHGDPGRLADLAVVVAGPAAKPGATAETRDGARDALLGLAESLDAGSRGAVVIGSDAAGTLVTDLRATKDRPAGGASTVDTAGSVAGELATVLALAQQLAGSSGDYGAGSGTDALVPDVARVAPRG